MYIHSSFCVLCLYFLCQFADSVLGPSLLSLLLRSSWMFVAYSFLNFCCCLCIASYFCRCLQLYIKLKITPFPPLLSPLYRFLLFQYPPSFSPHYSPLHNKRLLVSSCHTFPTTHWYFNLDSIEKADLET